MFPPWLSITLVHSKGRVDFEGRKRTQISLLKDEYTGSGKIHTRSAREMSNIWKSFIKKVQILQDQLKTESKVLMGNLVGCTSLSRNWEKYSFHILI
jgi:hypothetical protein